MECVENVLIFQTNVGTFPYQVFGCGSYAPYKIPPIVGIKVLPQVPYTHSIEIYNPFDEPLEITEVFTSGGFLHLSLPPNTEKEKEEIEKSTTQVPSHTVKNDTSSDEQKSKSIQRTFPTKLDGADKESPKIYWVSLT
jgi:hypothetical protein